MNSQNFLVKKKRVMSKDQLNNLWLARENAILKRKELDKITQKENKNIMDNK